MHGYYVQELEDGTVKSPKSKTSYIASNGKSIKNLDSSNISETTPTSEEILENTVWNQIRNDLREELGDHIDKAWFSKAEVKEFKDTKTLTITMPTRFMIDWVRNNYSHVIRRLTNEYGIKILKFNNE